jgi:hypothetical protein
MEGVRADFSGAIRKTRGLLNLNRAMRFQATRWAAETVKALKRSAAAMQKGHKMGHGKSGQLARAIGMRVGEAPGKAYTIAVGTGIHAPNPIKYAKIQDEGGTVRAKNASFTIQNIVGKPHLGPYLTVPLKGVKGRMKDYPGSFVIRSKKGSLLVVQPRWSKVRGKKTGWMGSGYKVGIKPLFVLKFSVDIPKSGWFTNVIEARKPELEQMMERRTVLEVASRMVESGGRP